MICGRWKMYSTSSIALVVLYTIARMVWDGVRWWVLGMQRE